MKLYFLCYAFLLIATGLRNSSEESIQDSEVQALTTTLKNYGAGVFSDILSDINSNCSDISTQCRQLDSQYDICTNNATEDAMSIASKECKVTCHVCPVFSDQITIFAPLNASYSPSMLEDIRNFSILGTRMLRSSMAPGRVYLKGAIDRSQIVTLNNDRIHIITYKIKGQSDIVLANGQEVLHKDIHVGRNFVQITTGLVRPHGDVIEKLESMPTAHDFLLLLRRAGLTDHLKDSNNRYTVFMPFNYAFAKNGVKLMRERENIQYVKDVLRYHIIYAPYYTVGLPSHQVKLTTLYYNGGEQHLIVNKTNSGITVNNVAQVYKANITASNGVIHIIDHVLFPAVSPPGVVG